MSSVRVKWDKQKAIAAADEGGEKGLAKAGDFLLELADQHVPYLEGGLRASGRTDSDRDGATVYYDTPYALKLHQDRRLKIHPPGTVQWLKKALNRGKPEMMGIVGDELRTGLNRGG